jgi:hypothetical protein
MSEVKHTPAITDYVFGPLKVRVQGLGVYTGGEHLRAACDTLSVSDLRAANTAAWKEKRAAARQANRVANATLHGCTPHDRACQRFDVAEVVCRETWKRIAKAEGGSHG